MAVKLDALLATFAIGTLLVSGSSYRERALLPFTSDSDTGFLGREVSETGLSKIVSLDEQDPTRFLPALIRRGTESRRSRQRNIAPRASGGPLTSPNDGSPVSGSASNQQAISNTGPASGNQLTLGNPGGGVGGGVGDGGIGPGGTPGPGFGNPGTVPLTTVSLLDPTDPIPGNPAPGTPGIGTPTVPTVSSPVPEPGVWLLFILGLFASGAALRRQKRQSVAFNR